MNRNANFVAAILAATLTACAVGNTHTFQYVPAAQSDVGRGRVVLLFAVDDQREYVVKGDEPASFVGEQRSGYGIPFNVTTTGNRPFAAIVQESVQRDLESAGFRVTAAGEKAGDVAAAVRGANASRALAVIMREFKSDTYNNINVDYDFEAIVYDRSGKELARNRVSGEDVLPGSFMNPPKAAKEKVPPFFNEKIRALVTGNDKIVQALAR